MLATQDVVKGRPLALDVVAVHPRRRELKALTLQNALTLAVHLSTQTKCNHYVSFRTQSRTDTLGTCTFEEVMLIGFHIQNP